MKAFVNIEKYGLLVIDKVIFESYYPIIFTCNSSREDLFICVCYQRNEEGCGWLVGKTQPSLVVRLLKDEISLRDLIDKYSTEKYRVLLIDGEYIITDETPEWSDRDSLPKENSFLYGDEGEFAEEIEYYTENNIRYADDNFYKKTQTASEINSNMAQTVNEFIESVDDSYVLDGQVELVNTLSVIESIEIHFAQGGSLVYENMNKDKTSFEMSLDKTEEKNSFDLMKGIANNFLDAA